MKQLSTLSRGVLVLCLMQVAFNTGNGQSLTNKANTYIDANCNGYVEYLPAGYTTSKNYPLIIAFHGASEIGDGSPSSLTSVANTGLPGVIKNGNFPSSVTVNGNTYQFIVIAPQFRSNPDSATMEDVYQYCLAHYPVDINRVYVTGYSQGGGNAIYYVGTRFDRAQKIAAVLTIAVSVRLSSGWAQNIASANLPVLGTVHADDTFYADNTVENTNLIDNSTPPPAIRADYVFISGSGHSGWTETYTPSSFSYNNMSVYQWMLQYSRNLTSALPVVLGPYTAQQTGSSAVTVSWTTTSEINNNHFTVERSLDGINFSALGTVAATNRANGDSYSYVDATPAAGNNFYRLVQVDNDGKTTYFNVLKVVLSGSQQMALRMSPNPVVSSVMLQLSHPETGDIQVVLSDMQGRVLRSWKFSKPGIYWQQTLDLGNIPTGSYTLQLRGATLREIQQFVKQ